MIPQKSSKVVSIPEFQCALAEAKNKGQKLRACLRTLASMGYLANMDPTERAKIQEYLDDFHV